MESSMKWIIAGGIFLVGVVMTVVIVLCSRSYKRRKKVSTATPDEVSQKENKNKVKNKNTSRIGRGLESEIKSHYKTQNKTGKNGLEYRRFTNQRRVSDQQQSDNTKLYIDIEIPKLLIPRARLERSDTHTHFVNLYPAELK